jgi:hypothetical protein
MFIFDAWRIEGDWMHWSFGFLCLALSVFLSLRTWTRMSRNLRVGLWEGFRTLVIFLIILTLFNPQKVEVLQQESKSQIICLVDSSRSMQTKDVIINNRTPVSRMNWCDNFLNKNWVKKIESNATLIIKSFSSKDGQRGTDIARAISNALDTNDDLRAILLLSDGDTNQGNSVITTAGRCRTAGVSVYGIIPGTTTALPDLSLDDAFAPSFVLQDERLTVSWLATNSFSTPQKSKMTLYKDGIPIEERSVEFKSNETISGNISWLPDQEGEMELEIRLSPKTEETYTDNNQKKIKTRVDKKIIRALIVDSFPRWEYRFLRNALDRDPGVDMSCILFHPGMSPAAGTNYLSSFPKNEADLAPYDVIFLGDVGISENELTKEQCELIANLIKYQAAGIIFMPGRRGRQLSFLSSQIEELLPINYDKNTPTGLGTKNPASFVLTQRGEEHWLTNLRGSGEQNRDFWNKLPGFHWSAMVTKSRPGSEVLAVHSNFITDWGKMPILAIRRVGSGKSLYIGSDSAWRWRRGVEDKYHYRFWSQIVRWMAHGRYLAEKEGIKLIPSPEKPKVGENVFLRTIILDEDGFPLEQGMVKGLAKHPDGSIENLVFKPDSECSGVYVSSVQTIKSGKLEIEVNADQVNRSINAILEINQPAREKMGQPTLKADLEQLSRLTLGLTKEHKKANEVISALSLNPEVRELVKIHSLRSNLLWGAFLFSLLAIYWTGRKFFGMV